MAYATWVRRVLLGVLSLTLTFHAESRKVEATVEIHFRFIRRAANLLNHRGTAPVDDAVPQRPKEGSLRTRKT